MPALQWFLWVLCCACTVIPYAQIEAEQPDDDTDPVVSRVGNHLIRWSDVEREMEELRNRRPWPPSWEESVRSAVLASLVDRWIVWEYIADQRLAATQQDVDYAWQQLQKELDTRGRTLDDYLRQLRRSPEQLRDLLLWSLSWKRFLDQFLTDRHVQKFFERHRRQFDGTRLRVAHILWRPADPQQIPALVAQAAAVRERILRGELTFAQAATQFSQAPTANEGGDIGWITRRWPMPESFSRAAFALHTGQVSEPVVTTFGVHLIQCLAEQPGQATLDEVRPQVEAAMAAYLFRWAADRYRSQVEVVWNEQRIGKPNDAIRRAFDAPLGITVPKP